MSIKVMNYVWEHSKQRGTLLLLLLAIADFADDEGEAYPGIKRLSKKSRTGERNTQKLLRKLEAAGEICIYENAGAETGSGKTNRYKIIRQGVNASSPGEPQDTGGVNHSSSQGVNHRTPKPSVEPSVEPSDIPAPVIKLKADTLNPLKTAIHDTWKYRDWKVLTKGELKVINDAAHEFAQAGVTPELVPLLHKYARLQGWTGFTPMALVKHLSAALAWAQKHSNRLTKRAQIEAERQETYRQNELISKRLDEWNEHHD